MTKAEFNKIVAATGKNFTCDLGLADDWRLLCDDELVIEDPACEDLYGTEEYVMDYSAEYLLEYHVPEDKKVLKCGIWKLK